VDAAAAKQLRSWFCSTDEARKIDGDLCAELAKPACAHGCAPRVRGAKCAGVRLGKWFVVSRHCVAEIQPLTRPEAYFPVTEARSTLTPTTETLGSRPYDLAVFKLLGSAAAPDIER
jgi:hypothetical protein